jgi:hypothetical protein
MAHDVKLSALPTQYFLPSILPALLSSVLSILVASSGCNGPRVSLLLRTALDVDEYRLPRAKATSDRVCGRRAMTISTAKTLVFS